MIKEISVFFPAYNDENTIEKLVLDAISVLKPLGLDYEIIIIDDCSQDNTGKIAQRLVESQNRLRLVQHKENKDYGGVLKTGFTNANKEWVFYTDGDGQYDIKEITRLFPYTDDFDFINGYILKRNDSLYRIILSKTYQFFLEVCFGRTLRYINCDFRLIKKEVIDRITIDSNSGFAPAEMVIKLMQNGVKVKEAIVSHLPRQYGHSQFLNLKKLTHLFCDLLRFLIRG